MLDKTEVEKRVFTSLNGIKANAGKWFKSEKGIIIWTSLIGFGIGVVNAWGTGFPSIAWWGKVLTGTASTAILFGVINRYAIAVNREKSGEKTDDIHRLVKESEAVLAKREKLLEADRKIHQFEQFLRKESYHNIRFPKLKPHEDALGLEYTIRPVRDDKTGEPLKYETEMDAMYVVKVDGPAHISVMDAEALKGYEDSPIRDGEYAFCKFFNESWHLGHDTFPTPFEFYLSGKVGPVEYGQTANQFMQYLDNQLSDKTIVSTFYLKLDGTPMVGVGGCDKYEIYTDSDKNLYLKITNSLPKLMYFTNPKDTYLDKDWFFAIEDIRGYASGQKLKNVSESILAELAKLNIEPKKVPWYETKIHKYEPPY